MTGAAPHNLPDRDRAPPTNGEPATSPAAQPTSHEPNRSAAAPSVALALVAGLLAASLGVLLAGAIGLLVLLSTDAEPAEATAAAAAAFGVGLLGAPLSWYAWQRIQGRAPQAWRFHTRPVIVFGILIVPLLVCGQLAVNVEWLAGIVLGPANLLAVALPTIVLLALAFGRRPGLSRLRVWAHLASGAWLATLCSLVAEFAVALAAGLIVLATLGINAPETLAKLLQQLNKLAGGENIDLLLEWMLQPWAVVLVFVGFAIVVPFVEELFKPLGVILLARRRPTPLVAYLGGVLGGTGFALAESLGNLAGATDIWGFAVLTRMATLVMHAFTGGLVGWGWGQVFGARRPGRLAIAFLGAVGIHGLWNGAVVASVFMGLKFGQGLSPGLSLVFGGGIVAALLLMLGLFFGCLVGLVWFGNRLRAPRDWHEPVKIVGAR